ncbi:MAG: DUF1080 domain-containing protein [Planctomycetes bacterium]|nr:DUF1080 domain-containing protein [Planctomycetota bacterium]
MFKPRWLPVVLTALSLGCAVGPSRQEAPRFAVQRATYEPMEGPGGADVTECVKAMVVDGRLSVTASNQVLSGDPTPQRRKRLRVEYTLDGKPLVAIVNENDRLEIPPPTPLTPKQRKDKMLAALQSDAPLHEKQEACRQLATAGGKEAVPVLAALLADEKLSHPARNALQGMPYASVDKAFRDALGTLSGKPLVGVIISIGDRRDVKATEALAKRLQDSDPEVAVAAAGALGRIGTAGAAKALEQALGGAPPAAQQAIQEGCLACADALAARGKRREALATYDRLRSAPSPAPIRIAALRGAILARQSDGLALLVEQLRNEDLGAFATALRVAQELPSPEVTQALADELAKLPAERQLMLVQTLSNRGDRAALPAVLAAAKSDDKGLRMAAIQVLPRIGDASALPTLIEALGSSDTDTAKAAQDSLASLPGAEADAAVMAMLDAPEPERRLTGLDLIGRRRVMTAMPALFKATGDADPKVRAAAFKRLGELGGEAEMPTLLDLLLKAKETSEVGAAEDALKSVCVRMEAPEALTEKLMSPLAQAPPAQKGALLRVLSVVGGPKALDTVRAAVQDANPEVHAAAIRALGKWKTADAAPLLLELAKTSKDATDKILCLRSYIGLAGNHDLPAAERMALCKQAGALVERDEERKLLLSALSGIQTAESLALVTPYLDQAGTKEEASAAAVGIAEKLVKGRDAAKVVEPLQKVVQVTANADLSKRAQAALKQAPSKPAPKPSPKAAPPPAGGGALFNGKDLTGWEGNPEFWSVQDGAITGRTTKDKPTPGNTFLIWKGEVSDFDLTLKVKFTPDNEKGWANSGVQFRSKVADAAKFGVGGYQADLASDAGIFGMLYEERGRGVLAGVGAKVVVKDPDPEDPANKKLKAENKPLRPRIETVGNFGKPEGLKPTEWNELRVIAKGNLIQLYVNGSQTVEVTDESSVGAKTGVLALQLHAGQPMTVQFKDIVLRALK